MTASGTGISCGFLVGRPVLRSAFLMLSSCRSAMASHTRASLNLATLFMSARGRGR
eukprot:CAMPEP_0198435406 /NCGR_PEP_ID=MMETSP1452-20131203/37853_1 /TAXON_ID=1181717 /ORGANISM="Synchroma pusillum, Strain CCMP3072" /LENGTH=55 /DNA_ID=CAMNT_0044155939 /DNA_START=110 /DNA_END=274 /DNA_ORIENTATION=+